MGVWSTSPPFFLLQKLQVAWVTRSGTSQLAKPVKGSQCFLGDGKGSFFFWKIKIIRLP